MIEVIKKNKGKSVASAGLILTVLALFVFIPPSEPQALIVGPGVILWLIWKNRKL